MPASIRPMVGLVIAAAVCLGRPVLVKADIDLLFSPSSQSAAPGDTVEIDLIARSDSAVDQLFQSVEAVFTWDPARLEFTGVHTTPPGLWFVSGFLPDPGGLNNTFADGNAQFQGGVLFDVPATPAGTLLATFSFRALRPTCPPSTAIAFSPNINGSETLVIQSPFLDVTGDISSVAEVRICPPLPCATAAANYGDVDGDNAFTAADLVAAVDVILNYGSSTPPTPTEVAAVDGDCDGDADGDDIQPLTNFIYAFF